MKNLKIEYLQTEQLTPYANNAKIHTAEQVGQIKKSIQEFGFNDPIAIWKNNEIIEGHGRLMAAQELGLDKVPVVRLDELTEEQRRAYMLVHNQLTMNTGFDMELLQIELDSITIDMEKYGFDMNPIREKEIIEDEAPEDPTPRCKIGDVWKLGSHRLICGDSTDPEVVKRLMAGTKADLYLTDPPYNLDYESGDGQKIKNDNLEDKKFKKLLVEAFKRADESMKQGAPFYIWHADSEGYNFRGACRDVGWQVRQCLIWTKNAAVFGRQDYHWKHEPCLYGWKDGKAHFFIDDRTQNTVIGDAKEINPKKLKKDELIKLVQTMLSDRTSTTVINEDRPSRNGEHPTMKPIKLIARLIRNSSKMGDLVLDTFGGSGSTLIACEQLARTCYMAELDPHYCDVIIQRWENLTGQKAEQGE